MFSIGLTNFSVIGFWSGWQYQIWNASCEVSLMSYQKIVGYLYNYHAIIASVATSYQLDNMVACRVQHCVISKREHLPSAWVLAYKDYRSQCRPQLANTQESTLLMNSFQSKFGQRLCMLQLQRTEKRVFWTSQSLSPAPAIHHFSEKKKKWTLCLASIS